MKHVSRNGVYYNLEKSPYRKKVIYPGGNALEFVFSSGLHCQKFGERMYEHRAALNLSLTNRFRVGCHFNMLYDIVLYHKIEKRDFYVVAGETIHRDIESFVLGDFNFMR